MRMLLTGILAMFLLVGCNENDESCIGEKQCTREESTVYGDLDVPVDRSKSKEY